MGVVKQPSSITRFMEWLESFFPPYLPDAVRREYYRGNLKFSRLPLILLGPIGTLSTLAILSTHTSMQGKFMSELARPWNITFLIVAAAAWVVMVRARRISSFARACLVFMLCIFLLMGSICLGNAELTTWMVPQLLVWQLAIAPLIIRTVTFIVTMCISLGTTFIFLVLGDLPAITWLAMAVYLIGGSVIGIIVYQACNRLRCETYLANVNMRESAFTDSLTGMLTRRRFMELAGRSMSFFGNHRVSVCACFIDLDDFKQINDRHGHALGDRVLTEAAHCIHAIGGQIKDMDATLQARHVISGRVGGEEFAMMMFGYTLPEAMMIADEVLTRVRRINVDGVRVSTSVGVACAGENEAMRSLLHRADMALLDAKARGKDCMVVSQGAEGPM